LAVHGLGAYAYVCGDDGEGVPLSQKCGPEVALPDIQSPDHCGHHVGCCRIGGLVGQRLQGVEEFGCWRDPVCKQGVFDFFSEGFGVGVHGVDGAHGLGLVASW
jgi:hypothetical protein